MKKKSPPKQRSRPGERSRARPPKRATARRDRPRTAAARAAKPSPPAVVEAYTPPPPPAVTDVVLSTPEPTFAARTLPEPERLFPVKRRAIFFDVENMSRPEHLARVIEYLAVDWMDWRTELIAVGNWKVIGRDTARLLARHGAHLVHSAPSVGVSDWSDLRIAVAAGVWLAGARPGDVVEIITDDRAFDAVGDVAASLGISFKRLSHQGLGSAAAAVAVPAPPASESRQRRRGRGGRGRRRPWRATDAAPAPPRAVHAPVPAAPPAPAVAETSAEPHTAPHDEIITVVNELMRRVPARQLTIDLLANELKGRGFSRPPGSPRLITRLRRIKEISVNRAGLISLVGEASREALAEPEIEAEPFAPDDVEPPVGAEVESAAPASSAERPPASRRRRRSRRGGRGRRRPSAPVPG